MPGRLFPPPIAGKGRGRGSALSALIAAALLPAAPASAQPRAMVQASSPEALAVTIYRDPHRGEAQQMDRDWPRGFAMITESRRVTLPPGRSTIRFTGVAEGMVAVSAIVTGLPGGTIEKNRNADLLSPAALVDGSLGNRVTVTRTDPATGAERAQQAIVRTRADGGLVLQTDQGYEAVRCAGLPERLSFPAVPDGLSSQPVFTIDTRDDRGGTYDIQLTYLSWGFDWQAHYVAHVQEGGRGDDMRLALTSWLTLLNDNGQSFPDAELLVVAGRLNIESDFQALSDPPVARPLQLTCYPLGSTAAGSPEAYPPPPPPPPPPPMAAPQMAEAITVTGARVGRAAMVAVEEQLGDLKLYRVPEPVTVSARGLKQVAFLQREAVRGELVYLARCLPADAGGDAQPAAMLLQTVNDDEHGLGAALPMGGIAIFEPSSAGDLLVGEEHLRDHAEGQDVEIELGQSAQVFTECARLDEDEADGPVRHARMRATLTNANPHPVTIRLGLGPPSQWRVDDLRRVRVKDGESIHELVVPANATRAVNWRVTETGS